MRFFDPLSISLLAFYQINLGLEDVQVDTLIIWTITIAYNSYKIYHEFKDFRHKRLQRKKQTQKTDDV